MKFISKLLTGAVFAATAMSVHAQSADSYPNKALRMVVPYAAGGGTDVMARQVARRLGDVLKQTVVVENRPGAGTSIAAAMVASAPADGYTMLWGDNATFAVNPFLYADLPYDSQKDFDPVTILLKGSVVLSVNADLPLQNVTELIAYAKAHPGEMNYGTPGNGTPHHLIMEAFKRDAGGLDIVHVPYGGEGPAMQDLAAGNLQVMFSGARIAMSQRDTGKTRPLAVSAPEPNPVAKGVPTFAEAGFPGFVNEYWHGLAVPAGTPQPIVEKLNAAVREALQNPELVEWMRNTAGTRLIGSSPEEMAELIQEDMKRSETLIKALDIKLG